MKISDIDPFSLPSVLLQNRAYLPNTGGVYFVIEKALILYIGQTSNLQKRWRTHHRLPQLNGKKEVLISWLECRENERFELERDLIRLHSPLLNREKIPSNPDRAIISLPEFLMKDLRFISESQGRPLNELAAIIFELGLYDYIELRTKVENYLLGVQERKQQEEKEG